jgi:MoaA/NifB/PqqE/SkfB family radical SAM enzyme
MCFSHSDNTDKQLNDASLASCLSAETKGILEESGAWDRMNTDRSGLLRPLMLFCETVNICNSRCIFCPYSIQTRPKGIMPDALFERTLQQYMDMGGGALSLTPMIGDILLDQNLVRRLEMLDDASASIMPSMTTNLYGLDQWDDTTVVRMLTTFRVFHISCYGISNEENRMITGKDMHGKFCKQMRRLLKIKRESRTQATLSIGFRTLYPYKPEHIINFLMHEFNEVIMVSSACNTYNNWGNTMKGELPGNAQYTPERFNAAPCMFLIMAMMVFWDGRVSACACCDFDAASELHLGHIEYGHLIDFYNHTANQRIWDRHQHGDLPSFCNYCSFHNPLAGLNHLHPLLNNFYACIGG